MAKDPNAPQTPEGLTVLSYNIHKGFSAAGRRFVLEPMREVLHRTAADVVMLQEVVGSHADPARRLGHGQTSSQFEFLADTLWPHYAYGQNALYPDGHHGNALLSRYPILSWENIDISSHPFESRGLLHAVIHPSGWPLPLHLICLHLALLEFGRARQIGWLCERVASHVPGHEPLLIAGDFNDWRHRGGLLLEHELGVHEVHKTLHGRYARTFPAQLPLLHLDRIYVRGLETRSAAALGGTPWTDLSDHRPVICTVAPISAGHGIRGRKVTRHGT
jgi:endonuclease/exonuclease/phosphatase family metal-dependent hydrolase